MEVCFLSGAALAALAPDEFEGKTAKAVKQALAVRIGVARFRLRLFSEHGSEIPDDEVFACAPVKLQMVVLDFYPADAQRSQQVISAYIRKIISQISMAMGRCTMLPGMAMLKACCCCLRQVLTKIKQTIRVQRH